MGLGREGPFNCVLGQPRGIAREESLAKRVLSLGNAIYRSGQFMNCPYVNRESGDESPHSTFGVRGFSPAFARELQLPAEPSHRDTGVYRLALHQLSQSLLIDRQQDRIDHCAMIGRGNS